MVGLRVQHPGQHRLFSLPSPSSSYQSSSVSGFILDRQTSTMAHDIFREQLAIKFSNHGHALWEPSPGSLHPQAARVSDVGYIREGKFQRLFKILLPAEDLPHKKFGVPEHHEPFKPNVPNHIDSGTLHPNDFCSAGVRLESAGLGVFANG